MDRPLAVRRHWYYVEFDSFVLGTQESKLQLPTFESWVPPAVIEEARKLYVENVSQNGQATAAALILRLASDALMKPVWQELYKKKRSNYKPTDQFVNPMYVSNASVAASLRQRAFALHKVGGANDIREANNLEAEASWLDKETIDPLLPRAPTRWSEQDIGVQIFFWQIYQAAREIKPVFISDIKSEVNSLRNAARLLRELSAKLKLINFDTGALNQIAAECDSEARSRDRDPKTDDRWIITRRVHDPDIRTIVADLSSITERLLHKTLYGTIATITNVVFSRTDITSGAVREMLRLPRGAQRR